MSLSEALPNSSVRPRISIVSAALASGAAASSALRAAGVSIAAPDAKVIITVLGRGSTVGLLASAWTNVAAGISEGATIGGRFASTTTASVVDRCVALARVLLVGLGHASPTQTWKGALLPCGLCAIARRAR